jgi:hypothetical protein
MLWLNDAEKARILATITPIESAEPFPDLLRHDFLACRDMPVGGGWGYSQSDAITFLRAEGVKTYDFVGMEYVIAEKRTYEELIIFRQGDARFSGIAIEVTKQALVHEAGKAYDRIDFRVRCWPELCWEALKEDWGKIGHLPSDSYEVALHKLHKVNNMVELDMTCWFDITQVFNSGM